MNSSRDNMIPKSARGGRQGAFTLIELLVVIAIIGIMATIGLPALKGMSGSNDVGASIRQLLDDLSYARLKAINERTTVYVVFVSDAILHQNWSKAEQLEIARHANLQFTSYALFAERSLGDQPGAGRARYITDWRTLPDGILIPTNKFNTKLADEPARSGQYLFDRPFAHDDLPFPTASGKRISLPYIAFDYQGRLFQKGVSAARDVIVPIARGSIVLPQEERGNSASMDPAEVIETPRRNATNNPCVRIDWLTGRARMVQPENVEKVGLREL